jgi:NTE family protein
MVKKIGIALCGGGARGLSQIGVLHALDQHGLSPHYISGASIGAIIGALYADGTSPEEIMEISKQSTMIKIFNPSFKLQGLSNMNYLESLLKKHLRAKTFEELKLKFYAAATNLHTAKTDYFSSGELIKPIMASAAVPLLFEPQVINGYKYVDSGILNNVPIQPIKPQVDILIGLYVHSHDEIKDPDAFSSYKAVFDRAFSLSIWDRSKRQMKQCDFPIFLKKSAHFSLFSKKDDEGLFSIGVEEAEKHIPEILKVYNS